MKQVAIILTAMIAFALAGLPQLPIEDDLKSIIGFVLGVISAGLGAFLGPSLARAVRAFQARR